MYLCIYIYDIYQGLQLEPTKIFESCLVTNCHRGKFQTQALGVEALGLSSLELLLESASWESMNGWWYVLKKGVLIVVIFFIWCSSSPELFLLFIIYIFLHLHYLITCGYTKLSLQLFENAHCFWSSCPSISRNFYSTGLVAGSSSLSCCLNPHCWFLNPQPSTNQHFFWADTIFHEQPKIVGTKKKNITQQDLFINPHIYTIFVF